MATEGRKAKAAQPICGSSLHGSRLPRKAAAARGTVKSRGEAVSAKTNKGPQSIANILAELMARNGLGRVQSAADLQKAWQEAAGPMASRYTRAAAVRRGKLEVIVANSTFMQELNFQKSALVEALARLLPDQKIKDLRFRLGAIE